MKQELHDNPSAVIENIKNGEIDVSNASIDIKLCIIDAIIASGDLEYTKSFIQDNNITSEQLDIAYERHADPDKNTLLYNTIMHYADEIVEPSGIDIDKSIIEIIDYLVNDRKVDIIDGGFNVVHLLILENALNIPYNERLLDIFLSRDIYCFSYDDRSGENNISPCMELIDTYLCNKSDKSKKILLYLKDYFSKNNEVDIAFKDSNILSSEIQSDLNECVLDSDTEDTKTVMKYFTDEREMLGEDAESNYSLYDELDS